MMRRRLTTTLCTKPMPTIVNRSDVPPELTKGSVKPVTGIRFRFMPTDTVVWKKIMAATP